MDCFETAVLCLLIHGWYFVSFAFSEPDQTRPHYPFLGSWIGSHPHRFVRIDRCVVDRDPRRITGQYLGRHVPPPDPSPPRDRILKCTKTEEFSSLNGKKGAEAGFRSRVGGRAYVKCTGWSGVGCEWAEMAEIQKKQNPTSVDRSRPRGHLGCKGGCLEYKRELLGARKWPGSGDA